MLGRDFVSWVFLDEVGRGWLGDVRSVLNKVRLGVAGSNWLRSIMQV